MGLPMDFEWVDRQGARLLAWADRSVLLGDVRTRCRSPDGSFAGVYVGLELAADWIRLDVRAPVYVRGMSRIETGVTTLAQR